MKSFIIISFTALLLVGCFTRPPVSVSPNNPVSPNNSVSPSSYRASNQHSLNGISVDVKEFGKDQFAIYFTFTRPIEIKDRFYIVVDGTKIASVLSVTGKVKVSKFGTRLKNVRKPIKLVIDRSDGEKQISEVNVGEREVLPIPETSSGRSGKYGTYRVQSKNNTIKILSSNTMGMKGYISNLNIDVANGKIALELSPYIAFRPYFGFEGEFGLPSGPGHITESDISITDSETRFQGLKP